tara:strand:- start:507 stop:689 length:183 start_codon:yes stop_codon:yes gene_type:complete
MAIYEQFMGEVDKMLDGVKSDASVVTKYKGTLNGRSADYTVMAQIANRAVERGKNGAKKK